MSLRKIGKQIASFISGTALLFNFIAAFALLLCYLAPYINPVKFWPMIFFALAYPFLLIINILFVLYWLFLFKRWVFLSLITIIIGWSYLTGFMKISGIEENPVQSQSIRIMSFNVKDFDNRNRINKETGYTKNRIFDLVKAEAPDIVCLQDFYYDNTADFNTVESLTTKYEFPYYYTVPPNIRTRQNYPGTATFSKYPIINAGTHVFKSLPDYVGTITDIAVQTDTFRILNFHFKSNMLSKYERTIFHEIPQTKNQEETATKFKGVFKKVKESTKLRAIQSVEVRQIIEKSPFPVILCCDLNDTHTSYTYKQITKNLTDSFTTSGKGFGSTHIGFFPVLRIDYIFHDPFFKAWGFKTIRKHLSDHYPIVTNLSYESDEGY